MGLAVNKFDLFLVSNKNKLMLKESSLMCLTHIIVLWLQFDPSHSNILSKCYGISIGVDGIAWINLKLFLSHLASLKFHLVMCFNCTKLYHKFVIERFKHYKTTPLQYF